MTITEKVYKNIGGTAYFECIAIANPMISNMITWSRESFDMTKTKQTYDSGGQGYLTVTELAKDDSGMFKCTADNRIGEPASREAQLIVMCELKKHVCLQNLLIIKLLFYITLLTIKQLFFSSIYILHAVFEQRIVLEYYIIVMPNYEFLIIHL